MWRSSKLNIGPTAFAEASGPAVEWQRGPPETLTKMEALQVFLLLLIANGSPILARLLLRDRLAAALDGGLVLADGHRLLGDSKTGRGLIAAVLLTSVSAPILGLPWHVGAIVGACAMLGDALSSFVKRRLGMVSGTMAPGLDQIPESLIPLLASRPVLGLSWTEVILLSLGFMVANLALSRLLFHLGVREHPH